MAEVDLHLHTTYSDGMLSPAELVSFCASRGLKVIAITDHDSIEGIHEALEVASRFPELDLIAGVELSCDYEGGELHMLGYYLDYEDTKLQCALSGFREDREDRSKEMVEKLRRLGIGVSWDRVRQLAGGAVGRPHIAQAMVEEGYVEYPGDAFDDYLGRGGLAYVDRPVQLNPAEAISLVIEAGGVAAIAHPTYTAISPVKGLEASLNQTVSDLKLAGLVGMEVYYKNYSDEQVEILRRIAEINELVPCGGSDYHASTNPDECEPGTVGPPIVTVEALKSHLTSQRSA